MTSTGLRSLWTVLGVAVTTVLLAGCASVGPATQVTVPDIKSVTGTWKGVLYQSGVQPEYITMTIRDDGTYDFESSDKIGTSRGSGKIVVRDGRIILEGQRGHGVGTLLSNPGGNLVMNVDATLNDNRTLTAKLWPSR